MATSEKKAHFYFVLLVVIFIITFFLSKTNPTFAENFPAEKSLSQIDLNYVVTIDDPATQKIFIRIVIDNIYQESVRFERFVFPNDFKPLSKIITLKDEKGHNLSYTIIHEYDRELLTINIPSNVSSITLNYEIDFKYPSPGDNSSLYYHLGNEFGIMPSEAFFFQIFPHFLDINSLKVRFDLPESWNVISRLKNEADYYTADVSSEVRRRIYDGFYISGPIAFGNFDTFVNTYGNVDVTYAIMGYENPIKTVVKESFFKLFNYYLNSLGELPPIAVNPPYRYLHISVPKVNGLPVMMSGHGHGDYRSIDIEDMEDFFSDLAHVTVHNWIPQFYNFPWPTEPFTEYYAYRGLKDTGVLTTEQADNWLVKRYNWYYEQTTPQERNTISVRDADNFELDPRVHYSILYRKGSLLVYVLNEKLKSFTAGQKNLDNAMSFLWDRVLNDQDTGHHLDDGPLKQAINEVTGYDSYQFFEDYFYTPSKLPIKIENGKVKVIESEINIVFLESIYLLLLLLDDSNP
jgi:hypothetical protein